MKRLITGAKGFVGQNLCAALDKGDFILAGITTDRVLQAVEAAVAMNENGDNGIPVPGYVEELESTKMVKIIQSYNGVVNKMVWRKPM